MKKSVLFHLIILLLACNQSDNNHSIISDINRKYDEINKKIPSLEKVEKQLMGESTEGGVLESYYQKEDLKKVVANYFGEMGKSVEEYYFEGNTLFFASKQAHSYDKRIHVAGSTVKSIAEDRYYFHKNKLLSWLNPEKKEVEKSKLKQKESEILQKVKTLKEKSAAETKVYSWVDKLNIRSEPNTKGAVIASVESGYALALTDTKSEKMESIVLRGVAYHDYWYKVRTAEGKEGWIFGGAVKQKNEQKGNAILSKEKFDFPYFGAFDLSDWKKLEAKNFGGGDVEGITNSYQKGNRILEISESDMGDYGYSYSQKLMDANKKILKARDFSLSPSMEQNEKNKLIEEVKDFTQNPSKKYSRVQELNAPSYSLKPKPVMAFGNWKIESLNGAMISDVAMDMKTLFKLSPLSIFDETAAGLSTSEKETLTKKGKSESWEITQESPSKLIIGATDRSDDEVKFYFLKNSKNAGGQLAVETTNGETSAIQLWTYLSKNNSLEKSGKLKEYSANAFVSKADKLPDSYRPQLHYNFIDDQTVEVSLYTWMDEAFENREIINKIFLKWNGEKFEEQIVKNKQVQGTNKFGILDKSSYDLSKLDYDGKIVNKKFWQDANGENMVLFTKKADELFIYHYAHMGDKVKLLRKVYDFEKDCDYDLTLAFIDNSIKVTDLDDNNFGELTFAYKKACISDVSPLDLKLIMLENGNKFIIRGTTSIDKPGIKVDGTKNVDASFNNSPEVFLSNANKIWESINK